ncbi:glycosyltransferase family 2 protein [Pseudaquidulcibacter saccharophilus]|uniref:glycosyltransferase family 2 protein n=1 Tax=Pseudaquidulcibacter saccharophilus TaxID=2831900 RepID=UPI001EFF4E6E|nr:glycosyltransferase family 2 protein [Pseudaquidulcibacter saccharophilus]
MNSTTNPEIELSIVMPCLNEAETLEICIQKCQKFIKENNLSAEIIIADNGSTDGSQEIATRNGARVVPVAVRGYGAALIGGIQSAKGKFVAMGDADDSYDFASLMPFIEKLRGGVELCMGNRFLGGIEPGAMPPLHKYLGNPVLSFLGRIFYNLPIGDFHCGLRAFNRESILKLNLNTTGMEFASEMVVKAGLNHLKMAEAPTTLKKDGRSRPPHLRSWRDGWRHLKFLLTFAPKWLYMFPALLLLGLGVLGLGWLLPGDQQFGSLRLGVHTILFSSAFVIMAAQILSFAYLARLFGVRENFWKETDFIKNFRAWFTVETGSIIGGIMIFLSIALAIAAVMIWGKSGYGQLNESQMMRLAIPSMLLGCLGLQSIFTSFFAGLLTQPKPQNVLH